MTVRAASSTAHFSINLYNSKETAIEAIEKGKGTDKIRINGYTWRLYFDMNHTLKEST